MKDVRTADQGQGQLETLGVLDVERDVALAALTAEERRRGHAHPVPRDRLDLDDVGAQIGEDHRAERSREVLAKVDDAYPVEGPTDRHVRWWRGRDRRRLTRFGAAGPGADDQPSPSTGDRGDLVGAVAEVAPHLAVVLADARL